MNPINSSDTTVKQMSLSAYTSENDILAEYTCIPGNQPCANNNWIGIWEGSQILWDTPPLNSAPIQNNNPSNSVRVYGQRAPNMNYIIGYGTGCLPWESETPKEEDRSDVKKSDSSRSKTSSRPSQRINIGTVGATVLVNVDGTMGASSLTKISAISVGNNMLLLEYQTPVGNIPSQNQNWIGIWPGYTVSFNGKNCLHRENVRSDFNSGQICVNGFAFTISTTYTVAYATGPSNSDIVATVTFTTLGYGS
jgi:hypothetical protein